MMCVFQSVREDERFAPSALHRDLLTPTHGSIPVADPDSLPSEESDGLLPG
jgi:hypothetical protein